MRITSAIVLVNVIAIAGCSPASAQACKGLDDDSKKALYYRIDAEYGVKKAMTSEDGAETLWANQVLLDRGRTVLPCLLEIYRNGVKGELWHGTGPEPTSGSWALSLIRAIDGASALPLYRDLYTQATDDLTRVELAAELVILGDSGHMTEVVSFLDAPPLVSRDRVRAFSAAVERALVAISVRNYRAALPTLQKLVLNESVGYKHVLAVYLSQLAGDVEAVKAAVGDARLRDTALLALKRMGSEDVLRKIADDPKNPAHEPATLVLQGRLGR